MSKGLQPKIPDSVMELPGYPELVKLHWSCIAIRPQDRPSLEFLLDQVASIFNNIHGRAESGRHSYIASNQPVIEEKVIEKQQ